MSDSTERRAEAMSDAREQSLEACEHPLGSWQEMAKIELADGATITPKPPRKTVQWSGHVVTLFYCPDCGHTILNVRNAA